MKKWIVQKIILRELNKVLDRYASNIDSTKKILVVWIARLDKILYAFRSLLEKLDDNKLDSEEIDQTVADVEIVIKNW